MKTFLVIMFFLQGQHVDTVRIKQTDMTLCETNMRILQKSPLPEGYTTSVNCVYTISAPN